MESSIVEQKYWKESKIVLKEIFLFHDVSASSMQDDKYFIQFVNIMLKFAMQYSSEYKTLVLICEAIISNSLDQKFRVKLFAKYGCCLFITKSNGHKVLKLSLVCLDSWKYFIHSTRKDGREHISLPASHNIVSIGEVPAHAYELFMHKLFEELDKANKKKGDSRSFGHNNDDQGHQKTPSFIVNICRKSIAELTTSNGKNDLIRGGFTDVGMHTDTKPRSTVWYLTKSILQIAIENVYEEKKSFYFEHAMANFNLWLLENQLIFLKSSDFQSILPSLIDGIYIMIKTACDNFSKLAIKGCELDKQVEDRCDTAFKTLRSIINKNNDRKNLLFQLVRSSLKNDFTAIFFPNIEIPKKNICDSHLINDFRLLAKRNLGILSTIDNILSPNFDFSKLTFQHAQIAMNKIETFFYDKATTTLKTSQLLCNSFNGDKLERTLDHYRTIVSHYLKLPNVSNNSVLKTEIKSRELLVVWIVYCLLHKTIIKTYPLLNEYGVALQWKSLSHLFLSDQTAIVAMLEVVEYLRLNTKTNEIFSLRSSDATFEMTSRFGRENLEFVRVWNIEKNAAKKREDDHWKVVQQKQKKAKKLRIEISDLSDEIAGLRNESRGYTGKRRSEIDKEINKATSDHDSLSREFMEAERLPPSVFQPLPSLESKAMEFLFFFLMPNDLREFSRISFTAQQMLVPRSFDFHKMVSEVEKGTSVEEELEKTIKKEFKHSLHAYYTLHSSQRIEMRPQIHLMTTDAIPKQLGFNHIDKFVSPSDGVYHPDDIRPSMGWTGGRFDLDSIEPSVDWNGKDFDADKNNFYFNPFMDTFEKLTAKEFTPLIISDSDKASKALTYFLFLNTKYTSKKRGNLALSWQNFKPSWLNKTQYLNFGSLRAFPNQQYRKVCIALHDNELPLYRDETRVLLNTALYHVGELELDTHLKIRMAWKGDIDPKRNNVGFRSLELQLKESVNNFKEKQREYQPFFVLIDIATFASQWSPECREIARNISNIMYTWATDFDSFRREEKSIKHSLNLRRKQCVFNMMGVLCHRYGFLDCIDVALLCKLNALAHYTRFSEDKSLAEDEVSNLTVQCRNVLCSRMNDIINIIEKNKSILTNMCKAIILSTPDTLVWNSIPDSIYCYEAISEDLFSVNILSGIILCNGQPIESLPRSILDHQVYKRTFGDRNFEVRRDASEVAVAHSIRAVNNHFYSFDLNLNTNHLTIIEKTSTDSAVSDLELLDGTETNTWNQNLPKLLREEYSHWVCREKNVLVIRGEQFLNRNVFYLSCCQEQKIIEIPVYLQSKDWLNLTSLLSSNDQLRLINNYSKVSEVLSKFENIDYIHTFLNETNGSIIFSLPRFGLTFEMKRDCTGMVFSKDYSGFYLDENQQITGGTFHNFCCYLLLKNEKNEVKMLTPEGKIDIEDETERIIIAKSQNYSFFNATNNGQQVLKYYVYKMHSRFKYFQAPSIEARLFLAALYAATGTFLTDDLHGMSGAEYAMTLIRECWVNRPLSEAEHSKIVLVTKFTSRCPGLMMLCKELLDSSNQLKFLYNTDCLDIGEDNNEAVLQSLMSVSDDALTEYNVNGLHNNYRQSLTTSEHWRILGHTIAHNPPKFGCVEIGELPASIEKNYFDEIESKLTHFVAIVEKNEKVQFPLDFCNSTLQHSNIGQHFISDLKKSWEAYQCSPLYKLKKDINTLHCEFKVFLSTTKENRVVMESYLRESVSSLYSTHYLYNKKTNDKAVHHLRSYRFLKISGQKPLFTIKDLLYIASGTVDLLNLNPFLSEHSCCKIYSGIAQWLKICVLEDKLERLLSIENDEKLMIQELNTTRTWDADKNIQWLVFEVINSLQIRPVQYLIAKTLIENPSSITQLNMGEGKTRVILPMLVMYWTSQSNEHKEMKIVRLNFLNQLLHDAYEYLHQVLVASPINKKLFLMPFNRDVKMNSDLVETMLAEMNFCQQSNGCLVVAPEHRLSLQLKAIEMQIFKTKQNKFIKNQECDDAMGTEECDDTMDTEECDDVKVGENLQIMLLNELKFIDVLDESDELLRHTYQLVYACGDHLSLDGGKSRWNVAENLLMIISKHKMIKLIIQKPKVAFIEDWNNNDQQFQRIRLLTSDEFESCKPDLLRVIYEVILQDPPHELLWLSNKKNKHVVEHDSDIFDFVTNPFETNNFVNECINKNEKFEQNQIEDLLSLRGFLAHGILFNCMQKRHRVDYGVKRTDNTKKSMAVPFRGCDTPAERAEYSHPDAGIMFTVLSYYYDGLSKIELNEALTKLFEITISAQDAVYQKWFSLSCSNMTVEEKNRIDKISKIDLSNSSQFELLYKFYAYNMETINFWLNNFVFPNETMQYPYKIVASPWNLIEETSLTVGFSGTNDNSMLLPLQIQQKDVDDISLSATNGKMLSLIISNDDCYFDLNEIEIDENSPLWKKLIRFAIDYKVNAIIDAGGLVAGKNNEEFANEILNELASNEIKSVVYFSYTHKTWRVRHTTSQEWDLHSSPIHERDALVYFDESRCRGADMKLKADARALLTVGPRMNKDKLMQAAGRLRQLDKNQKIIIVGPNDVTNNIRKMCALSQDAKITSTDVLKWIIHNTVESIQLGMFQWSNQGVQYISSQHSSVDDKRISEISNLYDFYLHNTNKIIMKDYFELKKTDRMKNLTLDLKSVDLFQKIECQVKTYCNDFKITTTTLDEECERELEKEIELEQEETKEIPKVPPNEENDWNYEEVFSCDFSNNQTLLTQSFSSHAGIMRLQDFVSKRINEMHNLSLIDWNNADCVTTNFAISVKDTTLFDDYLRPIDVIIRFTNGSNLLVSEREADAILKIFWQKNPTCCQFINMSYLKRSEESLTWNQMFTYNYHVSDLVLLQLFNGDTSFKTIKQQNELKKILLKSRVKNALLSLPLIRGLGFMVDRSDLDKLCQVHGYIN